MGVLAGLAMAGFTVLLGLVLPISRIGKITGVVVFLVFWSLQGAYLAIRFYIAARRVDELFPLHSSLSPEEHSRRVQLRRERFRQSLGWKARRPKERRD